MGVLAENKTAQSPDNASVSNFEDANHDNNHHHPVSLSTEDISYGRKGIAGLFDSWFVFGAAFLASMGGFSFGYDQGVISIINVMPQFHAVFPEAVTPFGKGFMTGMLELGAFVGCLFMPALADKISRKRAIVVVVIIFNIGAIMQTAAPNYGVLVAGRAIGGVGVGTLAMGAPIYISEIAPPNIRGTLLVLESISLVGGVVVSYFITYATRHMEGEIAFRLPFGLQMVGATILGIGINFYPYSPRWLALVGRYDDALKSLVTLRGLPASDERVQAEHRGIIIESEIQKSMLEKKHPGVRGFKLEIQTWLDLFRGTPMLKRTVIGMGIMFFQQFSGINAFIYYAPTLFQGMGQSPEQALLMAGIFNVIHFCAIIACFIIIDHVGRRPLAIWGACTAGCCWAVMASLVGVYSDRWTTAAGWGAVATAYAYVLGFGVSYSPLGWLVPAEVYPNACRAKGVALSSATNWISNFIVGIATPPMVAGIGFGTYIFFGSFCFMAVVWAYFCVPETKGKTLEQIDFIFGDNATAEEQAVIQSQMARPAHVPQTV